MKMLLTLSFSVVVLSTNAQQAIVRNPAKPRALHVKTSLRPDQIGGDKSNGGIVLKSEADQNDPLKRTIATSGHSYTLPMSVRTRKLVAPAQDQH